MCKSMGRKMETKNQNNAMVFQTNQENFRELRRIIGKALKLDWDGKDSTVMVGGVNGIVTFNASDIYRLKQEKKGNDELYRSIYGHTEKELEQIEEDYCQNLMRSSRQNDVTPESVVAGLEFIVTADRSIPQENLVKELIGRECNYSWMMFLNAVSKVLVIV